MTFDQDKHILLRDQAHKRRLTPQEYPEFEAALIREGIAVMTVECPEWPPVEKSRLFLLFGDGDPWEGQYWTGHQPAIEASDYLARRTVTKTAREMAGPGLAPKRLAYAWQVPEYDPAEHILMRQWLADNGVDIVDFLREFIPKIRKELGRDPLFEVANPHAQAESEAGGGYSPTRRALAVADLAVLEKFAQTSERYTYEADQPVSWVRSLDGTRWEARRQHEPQQARWANYRSWINRTLGDGAWTEADRSEEGYAFGPFMELWDDGSIYLWCYQRALDFLSGNPLIINGVSVFFTPEKTGSGPGTICRMAGRAEPRDMDQILSSALAGAERAKEKANHADQVEDETDEREQANAAPPTVQSVFRQRSGKPFWHPLTHTELPRQFHRASGSPLVVRTRGDRAEVRCWGDVSLLGGIVLNSVVVDGFEPWNSGYRALINAEETDIILGREREESGESQDRPKPAPEPRPLPSTAPTDVVEGAQVYSPSAVVAALQTALKRGVSLFGRSASDSAVVALTREGLERFLLDDLSDRDRYVLDTGGRNYDCENFAERLRVNLAAKHGVNGCMVVWGDGHAFNAFAVASEAGEGKRADGPEIVLVEPQSDEIVTELTGAYSVERRAEVLL